MLIFGVLNFEGSTELARDRRRGEQRGQRGAHRGSRRVRLPRPERGRPRRRARRARGGRSRVRDRDPAPASRRPPGAESGLVAYASNADPAQEQVGQGLLQQAVGRRSSHRPAAAGRRIGLRRAAGLRVGRVARPRLHRLPGAGHRRHDDHAARPVRRRLRLRPAQAHRARCGASSRPRPRRRTSCRRRCRRLIIGVVQVAILFGVGIWFGLQMFGDYMSLLVIVLIGSAIFLAVGFAIAGWAKNEDQAAPVANLVSLPMMFLSGVFFPRDAMPDFLAAITQFMPLTYVNEALRAIVNDGAGLAALGPQLLGMGVWVIITFVLAVGHSAGSEPSPHPARAPPIMGPMHSHPAPITRRRLLQLGAAASAAGLAACATPIPSLSPGPRHVPAHPPRSACPSPTSQPTASPTRRPVTGRVLYRDGALADGRSPTIQRNVSILVDDGRIAWIRPTGGEEDPGDAAIIDCAGAAFVPGMVDCHSHVTGPGRRELDRALQRSARDARGRRGAQRAHRPRRGGALDARRRLADRRGPDRWARARAGARRPRPMGRAPRSALPARGRDPGSSSAA